MQYYITSGGGRHPVSSRRRRQAPDPPSGKGVPLPNVVRLSMRIEFEERNGRSGPSAAAARLQMEPWRNMVHGHGVQTWTQTWFAKHGEDGERTWSAKHGEDGGRTWSANVAVTVCSGSPIRAPISRRLLLLACEALSVLLKTGTFPLRGAVWRCALSVTPIHTSSRHLVTRNDSSSNRAGLYDPSYKLCGFGANPPHVVR